MIAQNTSAWRTAAGKTHPSLNARRPDQVFPLFQSFQAALAPDYVFVVPLDVSSLCQPALKILSVYLIGGGVAFP